MENKQSKKGILIGLLSGIFLLNILTPIVLGPIPASARSSPKMHFGNALKLHPLTTPFHGVSAGEEKGLGMGSPQTLTIDDPMNEETSLEEYSPPINMMPMSMLMFSVGLILIIVFRVLQKHYGTK